MMTPRLKKKLRRVAERLIKDEALVFRSQNVRVGFEWTEAFVLVSQGAAHFYTTDTSDTREQKIESGKMTSEPYWKVMTLDPLAKSDDRVIPVIDGVIGGYDGQQIFEVVGKPFTPSGKGIHFEAPLKEMDLGFEIAEENGNTILRIKG